MRASIARQPQRILRSNLKMGGLRQNSSTSNNANADKLKSAAESAQKSFAAASSQGARLLGVLGDKAGNLLGAYRKPLVFNLSVLREVAKQVYQAERLAPPSSVAEIRSAYTTLFTRAASPQYWQQVLQSGEWKRILFYGAEAVGIFSIGEMIGRRHLVGYKLD